MKKLKACVRPKTVVDLRDLVRGNAEHFGDKVQYRFKEIDVEKTVTFNETNANMNALGTAFFKLGLMGKHIAVIGESHPLYMTAYYATVNGNGVIVPMDHDLSDEQFVNFAKLAEISAVVYTRNFNDRLVHLADQMPDCQLFIPIAPDEAELNFPKVQSMQALLEMGQKALDEGCRDFLDVEIDREKMCTLLFTSGTTGTSKGVMLCQRNLAAATNAAVLSMEYDYTCRFVDALPMHHSYEVTCGHFAICDLGAEIFINDSLKNVMRNFNHFKPTDEMLVPLFVETMYKRIWNEIDKKGMRKKVETAIKISGALRKIGIDLRDKFFAQITGAFGGDLRSIVCGGAPLAPQLIKDFDAFGITILEGYGITECSPLVAVNRPGKEKLHSVGTPVEGCQVKIDTDGNTRKDEDIAEYGYVTGEILVKGENVMLGYYKNEEATRAVFTDDGWFRTGDLGYMDKDGYIFITGRKKNLIILSNGKNVYPEEIEEYLAYCPNIMESVVLGRKNAGGEIVITALIYPDMTRFEGKEKDEIYKVIKEDINDLNRKLPVFKQIRDIELRDTEFEKTSSRKIKRYTVS
ncbi:MAG: AMP-binding protein [Clostridia bacterium]|nr:AMP-binding protein [Clostridia bacterium]